MDQEDWVIDGVRVITDREPPVRAPPVRGTAPVEALRTAEPSLADDDEAWFTVEAVEPRSVEPDREALRWWLATALLLVVGLSLAGLIWFA